MADEAAAKLAEASISVSSYRIAIGARE